MAGARATERRLPPDLALPATLLARYLFFLSRRPLSRSNQHFFARRLAGLKSLAPFFRGRGEAAFEQIAAALAALSPASFRHRAGQLAALLAPWLPCELPADVALSRRPPGETFLAGVRRVLLVLGPGIGVGDEILCFGIARWLRRRRPGIEIVALSAYDGLWQAAGVDRASRYGDHAELAAALAGEGPGGRADLTVMADFEKPDLAAAVAGEAALDRYVEISLGAGSIVALDAARRWLHALAPASPSAASHYASLERFLDWLGGAPVPSAAGALAAWPERAPAAPPGALTVLASPFTSKQEPSLVVWSRLLAGLLPAAAARGARLLVDPGTNHATEAFARGLAEAVRAAGPAGLTVELLPGSAARQPSLSEVLAALATAQVAVVADSFAAHAAPLAGCTTLVVAQAGLEAWRVPAARSFYFEEEEPPGSLAAGMRRALAAAGHLDGAGPRPWLPAGGRALAAASRRMAAALGGSAAEPLARYGELREVYHRVVAGLARWPRDLAALVADRPYPRLLPPPPARREEPGGADDLHAHLEDRFALWRNSNLGKYVDLVSRPAAGGEEEP